MLTNNTNQLNFVAAWVNEKNQSHKELGLNEVSVTELQREPRAFWLIRRHKNELEQDIQDMADSAAGTAIHEDMERFAEKDGYQTELELEEKLKVDGEDITIYGKLDCLKGDELVDIKNPKLPSFDKNAKAEEYEWYEQTMTYSRILKAKGTDINKIIIQARIVDLSVVKEYSSYKSTDKFRQIVFDLSDKGVVEAEYGRIKNEQIKRISEYLFSSNANDNDLPKCSDDYTWANVSWKIYKEGRKTALKVCTSEEDAIGYCKENSLENGYQIKKVVTDPLRCLHFCPANKFCKYYKELNVEEHEPVSGNVFWKIEDYAKQLQAKRR